MTTLYFDNRPKFGYDLYYPKCEKAKIMAEFLLKLTTIKRDHAEALALLDFKVHINHHDRIEVL